MSDPTAAIKLARSQSTRYLAELKEFVAIPSVSTLPMHKADMQRAAEWVAHQLRSMGMQNVEIFSTGGHPVVYGDWLHAVGQPTVLVYGHYDVQPADPLGEWLSPPFEPTVRADNLYARGASDMKGQVHAFLKALEAQLQSGELPTNVKVMVEGEEEIGSPALGPFIRQHADQLKCDVVLNADAGILRPDQPSLVYGLRGLAYFELWIYGPDHDLHSGVFGGSVHNPAQVLCELIAGMHGAAGRIMLPGFYDKVRKLTDEERANLARDAHSDKEWSRMAGVPALFGEQGFSTTERLGARPTLEVNGLLSGFTGEGQKTVLPARAMAKLSTRLVPYQDDQAVEGQLRDYLSEHAPPTVRWEVNNLSSSPGVLVERDTVAARAAGAALEATFGVKPVFRLEGGSIPVVGLVQTELGVDSILMGFGLPDDNLHAPNEKLHLPNYYHGIEAYIRFFHNMAHA
jgi:acetylornithine deacetylase/succinyl-diaminopimelate desuccinylase-like protein